MNIIQHIFYNDGRMKQQVKFFAYAKTVFYCLLDWRQIKHVFAWLSSLKKDRNPWNDGKPWVTYRAVDFMEKVIGKDSLVFEYGSGGSTLYFAQKAKHLTSIEHHKEWYKIVDDVINQRNIVNCEYILREPEPRSGHEYFRSTTDTKMAFKKYVTSINKFEDNHFDFVSVDGRARVQCVLEAIPKIKNGGYLMLDNSDRKDYFEAEMILRRMGSIEHRFFGLVGYDPVLAQTTIWQIRK